ncbi:42764_t:CDS:2 [Gigaspora margarita]|uniref:42764_t:CDS:1 n=1 Tax=Gigaspora margarita TaxID=4874 RepID=A0ABM8VVR4_GIGMA|nr:42764_t:CDS:2 [Gigaspora margarita]
MSLEPSILNSDVGFNEISPMNFQWKLRERFYLHNIYEQAFNGNIGAPVHEKLQNGAKVLEFGCEIGIWSTEVATKYPNTEFYVIDSFPTLLDSIDNITFIECDIIKKIPFPDNEFDYVIFKDKALTIEKDAFQKVLSKIIIVLKPRGESWLKTYNLDYDTMMNFGNYLQETEKPNIYHIKW